MSSERLLPERETMGAITLSVTTSPRAMNPVCATPGMSDGYRRVTIHLDRLGMDPRPRKKAASESPLEESPNFTDKQIMSGGAA